jgi:hypothetical protein
LIAGLNAAPPLSQEHEQLEFSGGQIHFLSSPGYQVPRPIYHQLAEFEPFLFLVVGLAALENPFHPQNQFPRAERFGDVIVGPEFQAENAVNLSGLGGEHDDGHLCGCRIASEHFTDFETVHLGQHQVQNDEAGHKPTGFLERFSAIGGNGDIKSALSEIKLNQFNSLRLVIHNQDFGSHAPFAYHG